MQAKIWAEKLAMAEQAREERTELERQIADERVLSRKEALEQREVRWSTPCRWCWAAIS